MYRHLISEFATEKQIASDNAGGGAQCSAAVGDVTPVAKTKFVDSAVAVVGGTRDVDGAPRATRDAALAFTGTVPDNGARIKAVIETTTLIRADGSDSSVWVGVAAKSNSHDCRIRGRNHNGYQSEKENGELGEHIDVKDTTGEGIGGKKEGARST